MRALVRKGLKTVGYRSLWLAEQLDTSYPARNARLRSQRTAAWYADPTHVTRRVDFPLGPESTVFDVGGFGGDWALEIFARYGCRVEVFEPVPEFASTIEKRFSFTDRIQVHEFGLGGASRRVGMSLGGDRSTHVHGAPGDGEVMVEIRDISDYVSGRALDGVDVMKLNIEGAEFELLERLLDAEQTSLFTYLLIQFHDESADAPERAVAVSARLEQTHELLWRFPFVWECWRRANEH